MATPDRTLRCGATLVRPCSGLFSHRVLSRSSLVLPRRGGHSLRGCVDDCWSSNRPMGLIDGQRTTLLSCSLSCSVTDRGHPTVDLTSRRPGPLYICAIPPSTQSSLPFTKLESSESRNSAAVAISSERPSSLRGIPDRKYFFASGGRPSIALVSILPVLDPSTPILHSA